MRYEVNREPNVVARLVSMLGPKALLSWALLLIVVFSMTSGLTEAIPNLDVRFVIAVAAVALTWGWLLALLPIRGWFAGLASFVFGVEFLLIRIGRLEGKLVAIAGAAGQLVREIVTWYWTEQAPDWGLLPTLYLELWADLGTLLSRTWEWLSSLVAGVASYDVVGTVLVWGFGVWLYSVWAGWTVRRHSKPLLGVLPGAVLLGFVLSYTGANPYIYLPILGITLLLMALTQQTARESRWALASIDFSQGLWGDIALTATGISIALVLASAVAPSVSAEKIAEWVREITDRGSETRTEAVAEGLGLEQQPQPRPVRPLESVRSTGLPQRHLIGSGPELTRRVVMLVETGELPALPEPLLETEIPRHYWRSITYDRYFGRGWATSGTETVAYEPGELLNQADDPYMRTLRQSVQFIGDVAGGVVHVDGTLVSVDQEFEVTWRPPREIFAATTTARQYRADSIYPVVTVEQLREAPVNYPEWLLSRYLQLPESVSERVRTLARDLTATQPTPYDRAVAIEQYLREFPYNLSVPTPGSSQEIADYFLFELQEGYCDYYATAMVVLARAAGLPARLVVGYVSGFYDSMAARYVVTEADAHAWPEIFFPGYGWIEFEPTGGRPPITRPTADDPLIWPQGGPPGPLVPPSESEEPGLLMGHYVLMGVGGVLLAVVVGTGIDSGRLLLYRPETMAGRLQRRLRRHAERLRVSVPVGATSLELGHALSRRLSTIAERHGFTGVELLEPAVDEIRHLTDVYVRTWYGRDGGLTNGERWSAVWTWVRLRWRLGLARLWRRSGLVVKQPEAPAEEPPPPSGPRQSLQRPKL